MTYEEKKEAVRHEFYSRRLQESGERFRKTMTRGERQEYIIEELNSLNIPVKERFQKIKFIEHLILNI